MPAWLAPVCEERSVSHSVSACVSSASQRAMVGALPSRIALQHRQSEAVDLEEEDPGSSVAHALARPPRLALDRPNE